MLDWALSSARGVSDGVVLVVAPEAATRPEPGADVVVAGGVTRSDSVRAGLAAVPAGCEVVLVHDAARPLASVELFESVVGAVLGGADGAVPGLPLVDTVKRVGATGVVAETIDRSDLVAVQTPQAFRGPALRRAHEGAPQATDDAGLVESAGGSVMVVAGERSNLKITEPDDLVVLAALVSGSGPRGRG